jgi:hypothetical protein
MNNRKQSNKIHTRARTHTDAKDMDAKQIDAKLMGSKGSNVKLQILEQEMVQVGDTIVDVNVVENIMNVDEDTDAVDTENDDDASNDMNDQKRPKSRRRFVHFGKDVIDKEKEMRRIQNLIFKVKVGTRIISFVAICALVLEIINRIVFSGENIQLYHGLITCFVMGTLTFLYLLHRNVSIAVIRKLFHEANVLFIIGLGLFNVIVEIVEPHDHMSVFLACTYLMNAIFFILFDAMERKSRTMIIVVGVIFASITIYNMYSVTFTNIDNNTILFGYEGSTYKFYKRPIKVSSCLYFHTQSLKLTRVSLTFFVCTAFLVFPNFNF